MQRFPRSLITSHCVGDDWPTFAGRVALNESFEIETIENGANGPIEIAGIKAGDDLAIHVERIDLSGTFFAPNGGPFTNGKPVPLEYFEGNFHWPKHFVLKAQPSVGSIAVLPQPTDEIMQMSRWMEYNAKNWRNPRGWRRVVRDPRGKHCHQDCRALGAGAIVHMKAQVDGAGICVEDVHGYIGQGEMSFGAIETQAVVQLRVQRSTGWFVDWPLIETTDEIMVFSSYSFAYSHRPHLRYVDVIREAYRSMCEVVAHRIDASAQEANTIVATAVDIRNCALYGLEGFISDSSSPHTDDIAVVAVLPKHVFAAR
jgi:acetamidase/formamidase